MIGTVYKEMKLKPNILDEYVKVPVGNSASVQLLNSTTLNHIYSRDCSAMYFRNGAQKRLFRLHQGGSGSDRRS